jgi:hypothetical protein
MKGYVKTATGLTLVAIGAILAFAVHAHLRVLNLNVVGWVVILTGLVGIFVPRSGYGWLRRRVLVRRTPRGPVVSTVEEDRLPPSLLNPEVPAADEVIARYDAGEPGTTRQPETETVEEYFEE